MTRNKQRCDSCKFWEPLGKGDISEHYAVGDIGWCKAMPPQMEIKEEDDMAVRFGEWPVTLNCSGCWHWAPKKTRNVTT